MSTPPMCGMLRLSTSKPSFMLDCGAANVIPTSPSIHEYCATTASTPSLPHVMSPSMVASPPTKNSPCTPIVGRLSRLPVVRMVPEASGRLSLLTPVGSSTHTCVNSGSKSMMPVSGSSRGLRLKLRHPEIRDEFRKLSTAVCPSSLKKLAVPSRLSPSNSSRWNTRSSKFPVVITVPVASGNVMRRFPFSGGVCPGLPSPRVYCGSAPSMRSWVACPTSAKSTIVTGPPGWWECWNTKVSRPWSPASCVMSRRLPLEMILPLVSGNVCVCSADMLLNASDVDV
mmetsp:Transcript_37411/g.88032  ORF Transcript_37411/g.88032 Transcript_37411/m.88032 type:complete len:284 (+) Transcript_37411:3124-3975(+)